MNTQNKKIGIIGAGDMGSAVAKLAARAGFEVYLSNSRGPATLAELTAELGSNTHAVTVEEAIDNSDIIVISIPFGKFQELPLDKFTQKIVIDAMNYIPFRDNNTKHLFEGGKNPSEVLQDYTGGSKVVKAFSNIYSGHLLKLARPTGDADRSALPIVGDDAAAIKVVMEFLDEIGWDSVYAGTLDRARIFDVGNPVFVKVYLQDPSGSDEDWGKRMYTDPGKSFNKESLKAML